ncbi:MAG: RelA/SpoT domain-containing protein [Oceanicaulis sp.]
MVNWIQPRYSKGQINRAGAAFRSGEYTVADLSVLENWRASHAYIINTFQANLRRRAKDFDAIVGQRLKRRPTILDKLVREPHMQLARMHDVAGCRIIFDSVDDLLRFREGFVRSRFQHRRMNETRDQFNYIENPKDSGYRGIHDVFKYKASYPAGRFWDGLLIEIQYRTKIQHAWATAVETADLLTKSRGKFSEAPDKYQRFFSISSEILARLYERSNSAHSGLSADDLKGEFDSLENECNILRLLKNANRITPNSLRGVIRKGKNVVLTYPFEKVGDTALYVMSFDTHKLAIKYYEEQEEQWKDRADVVLVSSEDIESVMTVFQNYFQDTRFFTRSLERAIRLI